MSFLRTLNEAGTRAFREYLAAAKAEQTRPRLPDILHDSRCSDPFPGDVKVPAGRFTNNYELGVMLVDGLACCDARAISRDAGLWNWLTLFYFEHLAPPGAKLLDESAYVLDETFDHRRYYRHLVRKAWLAVQQHGECAKVLLIGRRGGHMTEIGEQIGAQQELFSCTSVVDAAYRLYFDEAQGKPKPGSSDKGAGSPRRLAMVARQLQLTWDLADCSSRDFLDMLPREFDRWKH